MIETVQERFNEHISNAIDINLRNYVQNVTTLKVLSFRNMFPNLYSTLQLSS